MCKKGYIMNIQEYYGHFSQTLNNNMGKSLDSSQHFYQLLTKNRSFVDDFSKWIDILGDAPETYLYRNAAKVYQEAFANMLMGLYQPAFMGLRYFLERTLTGIFYSGNELELRTWLRGERDTYWTELIGREDKGGSKQNDEKDINVDSGLFSLKFTRAFFPEIVDSAKAFRSLTSKVYRNCSEFVHGNPNAINEIGQNNDFSESVTEKWNEYADTIIRCILYALVMRYWKFLPESSKNIVRTRVEEEFSTTDILKEFI